MADCRNASCTFFKHHNDANYKNKVELLACVTFTLNSITCKFVCCLFQTSQFDSGGSFSVFHFNPEELHHLILWQTVRSKRGLSRYKPLRRGEGQHKHTWPDWGSTTIWGQIKGRTLWGITWCNLLWRFAAFITKQTHLDQPAQSCQYDITPAGRFIHKVITAACAWGEKQLGPRMRMCQHAGNKTPRAFCLLTRQKGIICLLTTYGTQGVTDTTTDMRKIQTMTINQHPKITHCIVYIY